MRRAISLLGVLSLIGGTLMMSGSSAAAAAQKVSDHCGALTGSLGTMSGTVAKCKSDLDSGVGDATETGGKGAFTLSGSTVTITWNPPYEGSTAANPAKTVASISFAAPNPDESETKTCPPGTSEQNVTGVITADTTDPAGAESDVNGKVKGEVCVDPNGKVTLEPGSQLKFFDPAGG